MYPGLFIVFEGIDGSGKSTQAETLFNRLRNEEYDVILTREPGGSPGAMELRRLLVENNSYDWDGMTELLLFTAARRNHVEQVIRPHLRKGGIVICDRYVGSTFAYQQAAARGVTEEQIAIITNSAIDLAPDLTIRLKVTPRVGLERSLARRGVESRFEDRGFEFLNAVNDYYNGIYCKSSPVAQLCPALGTRYLQLYTTDRAGRTEAENMHDISMQIYLSVLGMLTLPNIISMSK